MAGSRINYRHIIWSLVRKPGAFARYRYREELFPSLVFPKSYDALCEALPSRHADVEYLRSLNLAAQTMESGVAEALEVLLAAGEVPLAERVKALVAPAEAPREAFIPELAALEVDLEVFDSLLGQEIEETVEVMA